MKYIVACITLSALFSCSTKDPVTPIVTQNQSISLQWSAVVGGKEAKVNHYYHMKDGDSILFNRLDFYIQAPVFKNKAGLSAKLDTVFLFSDKNLTQSLSLKSSELPLTIDSIRFLAGIDDLKNQLDPNSFDPDHPLSSYKQMYWTMGTKYRYIVMEGNIKTSGGALIQYSFHTGLRYKYFADVPVNLVLNPNGVNSYKIKFNIDRLFYPLLGSKIDYKNGETQAHGDAAHAALTDKVALNFAKAFSVE